MQPQDSSSSSIVWQLSDSTSGTDDGLRTSRYLSWWLSVGWPRQARAHPLARRGRPAARLILSSAHRRRPVPRRAPPTHSLACGQTACGAGPGRPNGQRRPMRAGVTGRLRVGLGASSPSSALPHLRRRLASLVDSHFPPSVAADVLTAVGFDPETRCWRISPRLSARRRDAAWRTGRPGGMGPPVRVLRVRRPGRRSACRPRGGACPMVRVGRSGHLDNGLALCMLSSQAVRPRNARARRRPGRRGLSTVLRPHDSKAGPSTTCTAVDSIPAPARPCRPSSIRWHTEQVFQGQSLAS